jgi:hypothetical protein
MADRMADGDLETILRRLRSEGVTHESIAHLLFADHGIEVTAQTVRNWCSAVDADAA